MFSSRSEVDCFARRHHLAHIIAMNSTDGTGWDLLVAGADGIWTALSGPAIEFLRWTEE